MAIPDYETIMLPLLRFVEDNKEYSLWQAIDALANQFNLTKEEQKQLLPSGQQTLFYNRVGWARTYMKQARLLEPTRRGYFRITERGQEALKQNLSKIDNGFLEQFKEFRDFKARTREKTLKTKVGEKQEITPLEELEGAYQNLRNELARDLLQQLKQVPPSLFENIVVELLVKMGYGGNRKDAGQAMGKTGDGGIDGVINEDRLGLDIIYIQAKRWANTVGVSEIRNFVGALEEKHARKGIFITTSSFAKGAFDYVKNIANSKVILIDGELLTQFMIDNNVGINPDRIYEIKKLDLDYFVEE